MIDNTISIKEYLDTRISAQKEAVNVALASAKEATQAALVASEKAVDKAEANAKDWRAQNNEWRQAMTDRERSFIPRNEYEAFKLNTEKLFAEFAQYRYTTSGHAGGSREMYAWIVGGVGLALAIAGWLT